jgi:hypothetical protein
VRVLLLLLCGSLLAIAACQPTILLLTARNPCGSWLASDGGLAADQFLTEVPGPTVGASLLAKAVFQAPSISNKQ